MKTSIPSVVGHFFDFDTGFDYRRKYARTVSSGHKSVNQSIKQYFTHSTCSHKENVCSKYRLGGNARPTATICSDM